MKLFSRLFQGFCAGLALTASAGATDEVKETFDRDSFTAGYDFYIGGLTIAEISFSGSVGVLGYDAKSIVETRGMLEVIVSGRVTAEAEGYRHTNGHLAPDHYTTKYRTQDEARTVKIAYEGEVADVSIVPPVPAQPYDTTPEEHPATLDPITAAVTMITPKAEEDLCNRTIPVFDGKRRYDIILLPLDKRPKSQKAPPPSWDLPTTHCFGVYERIAGFEGKLQSDQRYFPFDIWFENADSSVYRIVRLAGRTKLGYAIGTLRKE